jgi:hypothetical protein
MLEMATMIIVQEREREKAMVSIPVSNSYVFSVLNRTGNRKKTRQAGNLGWANPQAYLDVESLFGVRHDVNFIDRLSIDDTR